MTQHAHVSPATHPALVRYQERIDREKTQLKRWEKAQETFFREKKGRRYLESKRLRQLLDSAIHILARNPQNDGRSFEWFLREGDLLARKLYREAIRRGG